MADAEHQQGGPSTARRRKHSSKSKSQPANDWSRSGEPRSRASPRLKGHGDIDMDLVESSDDANANANAARAPSRKHRRQRRPQPPSPTDSDTSTPTKTPQRSSRQRPSSMRVPNASVPVLATAPALSRHRRPKCIVEEEDDDDAAPSGPSRPVSRQTIARRDMSPRSAHRYRSTPESRRSPRTSVSDSEDDTDATSDSDSEQVIEPRGKHLPPVPIAPAVPAAPPPPTFNNTLQERLNRRPEMVYEDDEPDATSRYAPSMRHRSRSRSRPPSSKRDHYRRPRDISLSGPPSVDETRSRSRSKRRSKRNYESDAYLSRRSSVKKLHAASTHSLSSSARRSTFFGFAASSIHPPPQEKPVERLTTCVSCQDDATPVSKTAKLKCLHRMCNTCLRHVFKLSLTDSSNMPPRCCTADHIPLEHVEKLFDAGFKREWNHRFLQYSTRNRLYCPNRRCGEWIKSEDVRREGGRKLAKCSRCGTKVCGSCSGRWHHRPDCPRDDEAMQFLEQAKRDGRRSCHRCKSMVELKDGSDHITCRCGAEFCMICGGKWKTCECPWFKYDPFEGDAIGHEHAMNPRGNPFAAAPPYASRPPSPRDFRSDFGPSPAVTARQRPASYEEETYLRRLHEQRDEHLARRMHSFDAFGHHASRGRDEYGYDEPQEPPEPRERRRRTDPRAYGAPFVDDEYHRRPATVVAPSPPQPHVPAAPPPPRSAFEPPLRPAFDRGAASAFEYGAPAPRSRPMRYASPERFDEYMAENYTPERQRPQSPDRWASFPHERRARSTDRRHTFPIPSESRPASPETWQQLPTRYPSPERPVPAAEERRRPPSPDRRRTSSLERRLADRFKPESRQSPAAASLPIGAAGPIGAVGPLGAVVPMGPLSPSSFPPPSRAATHPVGTGMPMAPVPPPTVHGPPPPNLRRHHTMDEEVYGAPPMHPGMPPAGWFGPPPAHPPHPHPAPPGLPMHHTVHEMAMDGSPRAPHVRRRPPPQAHREHNKFDAPRPSVLAGLGGIGRGMHRVSEWVNYVEPGDPDQGAATVM